MSLDALLAEIRSRTPGVYETVIMRKDIVNFHSICRIRWTTMEELDLILPEEDDFVTARYKILTEEESADKITERVLDALELFVGGDIPMGVSVSPKVATRLRERMKYKWGWIVLEQDRIAEVYMTFKPAFLAV
jgi:hypothetical protein